jgi:hypothetical protein
MTLFPAAKAGLLPMVRTAIEVGIAIATILLSRVIVDAIVVSPCNRFSVSIQFSERQIGCCPREARPNFWLAIPYHFASWPSVKCLPTIRDGCIPPQSSGEGYGTEAIVNSAQL